MPTKTDRKTYDSTMVEARGIFEEAVRWANGRGQWKHGIVGPHRILQEPEVRGVDAFIAVSLRFLIVIETYGVKLLYNSATDFPPLEEINTDFDSQAFPEVYEVASANL